MPMQVVKKMLLLVLFSGIIFSLKAQFRTNAQQMVLTNEDSLNNGTVKNKTVISGYGSAFYQRDFNKKEASATLERAVLFVGHKFNDRISLFTELEVENAKVEGGEEGGEIAMEQAFVKFNLNSKQYLVAGLFIPRIGIINENHLPVNFNGVERPVMEEMVIPSTWREIGVGFYGSAKRLPLNYSVALMNGLNSEGFEHGTGIRGGRAEGRSATANNLALTSSIQYSYKNLKFQLSGYLGGTVGLNKKDADSLGLKGGAFGTPVFLTEGNMQYFKNGFSGKILAAYISFADADKINTTFSKNMASGMYGAYAEAGYDWLYRKKNTAQFITFARCELIDLNSTLPAPPKAIYDGTLKQTHIITGLNYLPIPNITIKADVRILRTGAQNPDLDSTPYQQNNQFLNIGIGYSF